MTAAEIAAYIGAAAWLPQLLQWLYAWLKSPKLKLLSSLVDYEELAPALPTAAR